MPVQDLLKRLTKRQLFLVILALLAVLTIFGSLIANFTYLSRSEDDRLYIAVVGPMSGKEAVNGESMRQGAELYVEAINEAGGVDGGELLVQVHDDENDPLKAKRIAQELAESGRAAAVIGHWSPETSAAAASVYAEAGLPVIMPAPGGPEIFDGNKQMFAGVYHAAYEDAFLANYTRNVLGQKTASIIHDMTPEGLEAAQIFEDTYGRFGTRIRYKWGFDSLTPGTGERMAAIAEDLKPKLDAGTVFIAAGAVEAARMLAALRDAGARNPVVGTSTMATRAFTDALGRTVDAEKVSTLLNGIVASTPLLFDTANEEAQEFNARYQNKFGAPSDWVAAYAYDAAHTLVEAFKRGTRGDDETAAEAARRIVTEQLTRANTLAEGIRGITGVKTFDKEVADEGAEAQARASRRQLSTPVLVGQYDGSSMVSALTQLQPIKPGTGGNYIEELKQGRVLYVNDRFMYKTNVVYTGLQLEGIDKIDEEAGTVELTYLIWFRYRGDFQPEDVLVANATEDIKLIEPLEQRITRGLNYRLFRVQSAYNVDFSDVRRPYGTMLLGLEFRHRTLNRNNLQYVVDVLGLGLDKGTTFQQMVERGRALNPKLDWKIDRAWISQEVDTAGGRGDPTYVGYGTVDPLFSTITLGVLVSPAEFSIRDFVPSEYFVYLTIFGLLGTLFAVVMDRKKHGRFWAVQSWMLRVMAWPVLLLAGGNLLLDFAVANLNRSYVDTLVLVYKILWWVIPARLVDIAVERFVWIPLEEHTRRMVPNVIRFFGQVNIYILAGFGIIAFVYDQKITSLLATSGLLAMIIGLAIQANISNIFSGIAINVERPYVVGDWVKIGDLEEGEIIDITWRTIRIKTRGGYTISMPNAQASESPVQNFTSGKATRLSMDLNADPDADPRQVIAVLQPALEMTEGVLKEPKPTVRYNGTVDGYNDWGGSFSIQYWIGNYAMKETIASEAWNNVWAALDAANIEAMKSGSAKPTPAAQPA